MDDAPSAQPELPAGKARTLDCDGIKAIIPHRDPFLFIDQLLHVPSDHSVEPIVSQKNILPTDTYLAPAGMDYVPPPHLVEIAAQTGCAYLLDLAQNSGKLGYFMSIDNADFLSCVRTGDQLTTFVQIQSLRERFGKCTGQMYVGDRMVAKADVKFAFVEG